MLDKTALPTFVELDYVNASIAENIPISGHYNDCTLITKNGALLKTIEITGENFAFDIQKALPDLIREAIIESVDDYKISVYIHTIRSRKNIMPKAKSDNPFCNNLNDAWCKQNNFDKQLVNTIYVTFVLQGADITISNNFFPSIAFGKLKREILTSLEEGNTHLEKVAEKFLEIAKQAGPRVLTTIEVEDGVLSEPLMFFQYLVQLDANKVYLPLKDASNLLANHKLKFNYSDIVISGQNHKQFAALFDFKDYYKMPAKTMDAILHIGSQFILTQTYIFIPKKLAITQYQESAELVELSGDKHLEEILGFDHILNTPKEHTASYCKVVTHLLVHSDLESFFKQKVYQLTNVLHQTGVLAVREDFFLPRLFWSTLPGNLQYIAENRMTYMDGSCIAEYASIFHSESGGFQGSIWGDPVTLVRTSSGTPYFFNFHDEKGNGSTVIIGPADTGKSTIARFLMTQSQKFDPVVYYFDLNGESTTFLKELDAEFFDKERIMESFKINGFDFLISRQDPSFIMDWLCDIFNFNKKQIESYRESLDAMLKLFVDNKDITQRILMFKGMIEQLNDTKLATAFDNVFVENQLFSDDLTLNTWKLTHNFNYFALDWLRENPALQRSYFSLMLLKIIFESKGNPRPKIFYINDLRVVFKSTVLRSTFKEIIDLLRANNAILISNFHHDDDILNDKQFLESVNAFGSRIFTSDKNADKYFKRAYNLTEDELFQVKAYSVSRRMFLLRQGDISTVLALKFDGLKDQLKILESKNAKISE